MMNSLEIRIARRRGIMRVWYSIYVIGALLATLMSVGFTDACSAMVIGALAFWLTTSTFITYPALVRATRGVRSFALRNTLLCFGIICLWMFSAVSIIVGMLLIPIILEALAPVPLLAGKAGAASLMLVPLLGHGSITLYAEDAGYAAIGRCLREAHLPKSFPNISLLVDFCQTREMDEEADLVSKTTLALAEHGYFSSAA